MIPYMQLEIKITGEGTANEIAAALKGIAFELESGDHINGINEKGECEWEGPILMTTITEA